MNDTKGENQDLGRTFEREFCDLLSQRGFWVHNFRSKEEGQPADIIAARHGVSYLIDCKVCSTHKGFELSRIEPNQTRSMTLWFALGNGVGWFALKTKRNIYMLTLPTLKRIALEQSYISEGEMIEHGVTFDEWEGSECK